MELVDMLAGMLGGKTATLLRWNADAVVELRLRVHREARIQLRGGACLQGDKVSLPVFRSLLNRLMQNSMYACERELQQGYFTAAGGCRVGVCGRINAGKDCVDGIAGIGSVCIRIPREIRGCADGLAACLLDHPGSGMLLLSPPGLGKTTMLRDLVRILSDSGKNIAVSDERREIAACMDGLPQLDVGSNTDVMDGLPKKMAIPMLVRACAPGYIAVDELGGEEDAHAVLEAHRCGVKIIATAHAGSIQDARLRAGIAMLLKEAVFDCIAILGDVPGKIKTLKIRENEGVVNAEGRFADIDIARLHGGGKISFQCTQTQV